MTKILKTSGLILGVIILLLLLGFGALVTFVSPDSLKPLITDQVFKYTGRRLNIDGHLSWSLFPYLAVHVGHSTLNNPPQFKEKTFAEFDHATVGIKLSRLLHSSIESSDIFISGLKLNLIENADGETNWQMMQESKPTPNAIPEKQAVPGNKKLYFELEIPIIKIKDATITWNNAKTSQSAKIDKFNFRATDISFNQAFPISATFNFSAKNPDASGDVTLEGDLGLNSAVETPGSIINAVSFKGSVNMDTLLAGKLKATKVNVNTQLQKGVMDFSSITANFYQGTFKGQATVGLNAASMPVTLKAVLANVQVQPLLGDLKIQSSKYTFKGVANIDLKATTNLDNAIKNLNGDGDFSLKNGVLEGVNLGYMIDSVVATMKGHSAPARGENLTNFGDFTGTANIQDGVISNKDLAVSSPRFNTTGQGTIDLVNQRINYMLQAKPILSNAGNKSLLNNLFGVNYSDLVFPISITGSLQDPNVNVDKQAIISYVTQQKIKSLPHDVQKVITNKIPKAAGSLLKGIFGN